MVIHYVQANALNGFTSISCSGKCLLTVLHQSHTQVNACSWFQINLLLWQILTHSFTPVLYSGKCLLTLSHCLILRQMLTHGSHGFTPVLYSVILAHGFSLILRQMLTHSFTSVSYADKMITLSLQSNTWANACSWMVSHQSHTQKSVYLYIVSLHVVLHSDKYLLIISHQSDKILKCFLMILHQSYEGKCLQFQISLLLRQC